MIYDAVERANTVLAANFTADLDALFTAKNLTGLDSMFTVYKRQMAELFADVKDGLPGIGIYTTTVATQAVRGPSGSGYRDSDVQTVFDYYARGTDATKLAQQVELAAEALLRTIDRMTDETSVIDAGGPERSVLVEFSPTAKPTGMKYFERRVAVSFPTEDRDTGI